MEQRTVNENISIGKILLKNDSTFMDSKRNYGITSCFGNLENTL